MIEVDTLFEEFKDGAFRADEADSGSECALTISTTPPTLQVSIEDADERTEGDDEADDKEVSEHGTNDRDRVLR